MNIDSFKIRKKKWLVGLIRKFCNNFWILLAVASGSCGFARLRDKVVRKVRKFLKFAVGGKMTAMESKIQSLQFPTCRPYHPRVDDNPSIFFKRICHAVLT